MKIRQVYVRWPWGILRAGIAAKYVAYHFVTIPVLYRAVLKSYSGFLRDLPFIFEN